MGGHSTLVLGGGEAGGGVGPVPGRLEEISGKHIITNKIAVVPTRYSRCLIPDCQVDLTWTWTDSDIPEMT